MDKVVKFLEKYVQWLAMGLAGLYVLWAAYAYIWTPPLTEKVGTPAVVELPGKIDQAILDTSARKLDNAMKAPDVAPPRVQDVLTVVVNGINEGSANAVALAGFNNSMHRALGSGPVREVNDQPLIADLPRLPAATPDQITSRWTVVMMPSQPAAAPAVPAAGAAAAGGVGAPPAAPPMVRRDVAYVSTTFKLDFDMISKEITRCFSQKNVPPALLTAEFVKVELLREEQGANGAWSAPAMIGALPVYQIMPDPRDQKPPLTGQGLKEAFYGYHEWLEQNQDIIVHPAFLETAPDAEAWVAPGVQPPVAPAAQPGQAPGQAARAADEARRQQQAQADAQRVRDAMMRRRPVGPGGVPGRGVGPPSYHGPYAPYGAPPVMPGRGLPPVGPGLSPQPGPVIPNAAQPNMGIPAGADSEILCHDITIQEGKTYRYAVRYRLYNAMYDKNQLAIAKVAEQFDIASPDPADPKTPDVEKLWTAPVTVEPLAHIFVAHVNAFNLPTADFVVYTWKNGRWTETSITKRAPGDAVKVESSAPWTLVDVRKGLKGETYVIIMDAHGVISQRDEASDTNSPVQQKLKNEASASAAAR